MASWYIIIVLESSDVIVIHNNYRIGEKEIISRLKSSELQLCIISVGEHSRLAYVTPVRQLEQTGMYPTFVDSCPDSLSKRRSVRAIPLRAVSLGFEGFPYEPTAKYLLLN